MLIFDRLLSEAPHLNKNNPGKKERLQLRRKHYNMLVQTNRAYHSIERKALIAHNILLKIWIEFLLIPRHVFSLFADSGSRPFQALIQREIQKKMSVQASKRIGRVL